MSLIGNVRDAVKEFLRSRGMVLRYKTRFSWTGYKNMKDRNALIDAILTAYDNPKYLPVYKDGKLVTTYCNMACNEIAKKMGCNDLDGKMADEIYDYMVEHPENWQEVQCANLTAEQQEVALTSLQFFANSGLLVFAVAKSTQLNASHGHICIIRPGLMKESGKWGKVPAVMNVGGDNFIALGKKGVMKGLPVGLNQAFQPMPRFFVWKRSGG